MHFKKKFLGLSGTPPPVHKDEVQTPNFHECISPDRNAPTSLFNSPETLHPEIVQLTPLKSSPLKSVTAPGSQTAIDETPHSYTSKLAREPYMKYSCIDEWFDQQSPEPEEKFSAPFGILQDVPQTLLDNSCSPEDVTNRLSSQVYSTAQLYLPDRETPLNEGTDCLGCEGFLGV